MLVGSLFLVLSSSPKKIVFTLGHGDSFFPGFLSSKFNKIRPSESHAARVGRGCSDSFMQWFSLSQPIGRTTGVAFRNPHLG